MGIQDERGPSFIGGKIDAERGPDLLGFQNKPVVEPVEHGLLARHPPHLTPALNARRPWRGLWPSCKAVVSSVGLSGHPGCVGALCAHHSCVTSSGVCVRAQ